VVRHVSEEHAAIFTLSDNEPAIEDCGAIMTLRNPAVLLRALLVALSLGGTANAEVIRVEIASRTNVPSTDYERIAGRLYFAIDPTLAQNAIVADLDKVPRNSAGRVEFSSEFSILRPQSRGNSAALVDIINRGNSVTTIFNRPARGEPLGDRFLLKRGFSIAAVAWEFDVTTEGALKIHVPHATEGGKTITGIVRSSFLLNERATSHTVVELAVYKPVDPSRSDTVLTVRDSSSERGRPVPKDQWRLAGNTITFASGFEPGRTYEISYLTSDPPVGGLGFVAVRDFTSWLKHGSDSLAPVKYAHAYGSSQTGRFLRTFLYQGFNTDERNRQVFDGLIANVAGAARIDLNLRWSVPSSAGTTATSYPFADAAQRDTVSGATDGALDNPRARSHQPKIFYTNSAVEYWSSAGRAAALVHTTPDGSKDIELPSNVRAYFLTGAQHGPGTFPPQSGIGQQKANPNDYRWIMRALLVAMDEWVRNGTAPPPSKHPRLDDGTLVKASTLAFPSIPNVPSPRSLAGGIRLASSFIKGGAGGGVPLPFLVPQVDADGNERAGIRLPEIEVPLATYTGWNFRSPRAGNPSQTVGLVGSYIPLPRTRADRAQSGDPRTSIEERYSNRERYAELIRAATAALVKGRYVLSEDVEPLVERALAHWDWTVTTMLSNRSQ
jgi:hypothetical protein